MHRPPLGSSNELSGGAHSVSPASSKATSTSSFNVIGVLVQRARARRAASCSGMFFRRARSPCQRLARFSFCGLQPYLDQKSLAMIAGRFHFSPCRPGRQPVRPAIAPAARTYSCPRPRPERSCSARRSTASPITWRRTKVRTGSNPPSRKSAPITASMVFESTVLLPAAIRCGPLPG